MKLLKNRQKSKSLTNRSNKPLSTVVFAIGIILVLFAVKELRTDHQNDAAAYAEYALLRNLSTEKISAASTQEQPAAPFEPTEEKSPPETTAELEEADLDEEESPHSLLSELNPHYVGWIVIPGTTIDYPVVRGPDNALYLNTTFSGNQNPAGAIFMDYRLTDDFNEQVCLVYGHNMRNDSMFSPLINYLNPGFMDENPEIIILTADGEKLVYRIYEARRTDAWDSAYSLDHDGEEQLLILSTCIDGSDRTARLLVYAK